MAVLAVTTRKIAGAFSESDCSITVLELGHDPMTDLEFADVVQRYPNLESLIVNVSNFSSDFFDKLENLTQLRTLHLVGKPKKGFFDFDPSLEFENIEILTLEETTMSGKIFREISLLCPKLQELYLKNIDMPHQLLESLKHFKSLTTLSARNMRLEEDFFEAVSQLTQLTCLDLSQSQIGVGLKKHKFPGSLTTLNVTNTTQSFFDITNEILVERSGGLNVLGMETSASKLTIHFDDLTPLPPLNWDLV